MKRVCLTQSVGMSTFLPETALYLPSLLPLSSCMNCSTKKDNVSPHIDRTRLQCSFRPVTINILCQFKPTLLSCTGPAASSLSLLLCLSFLCFFFLLFFASFLFLCLDLLRCLYVLPSASLLLLPASLLWLLHDTETRLCQCLLKCGEASSGPSANI